MFRIASTDSTMIPLLNDGKVGLMDGFDPDRIAHLVTTQDIGTLSLMPATITAGLRPRRPEGLAPQPDGVQPARLNTRRLPFSSVMTNRPRPV